MKTKTILITLIAMLAVTALVFQSCKKDDKEDPTPPVYINGEGEIGSIGGTVKIDDPQSPINGTFITIPEGALNTEKKISISYDPNQKCIFDSTAIIVTFEPAGLTFNEQVEIGIPYESGADTSDLKVFYYDSENESFHQITITGINVTNRIITASTDHFSGFLSTTKYARIYTELVKVDNTLGALVEITSEKYGQDNGLHLIYTLPSVWSNTSYWNARDIINYHQGQEVLSVFRVTLKRKITIGKDEEIQSKKLIVRRIENSFGTHGYEVYVDNINSSNRKFQLNPGENEQIFEKFIQGIPLIFKFDEGGFQPDDNHKYYVNIEWALATDVSAVYMARYTHLYEEDNRKEAKKPTSMNAWDNDNNPANYVNDNYEGGGDLPTVTTNSVSNITETSATCGGNVTDQGSSAVTARGVCWSTSSNPTTSDSHTTDGIGTGNFTSNITGLTVSTTYYVRAYATSSAGTAYGNQVSFTTGSSGPGCQGITTITDPRDGQVYPTIEIGSQCWLQKNMNYETGSSRCYDDVQSNCETYGRLYDWQTALGACPTGWHLPSDPEWTFLTYYLGGGGVAGGKMKSTSGWDSNGNGSNSSGFTALPGGRMTNFGISSFGRMTMLAGFWSSSEYSSTYAWRRTLSYSSDNVDRNTDRKIRYYFSVRCLKD